MLGCQETPSEGPPALLRLNPTSLRGSPAGLDVSALFDRDTTTGVTLSRPVTLTLTFAHDVHPRRLKVFARGGMKAELSGAPAYKALGNGAWESLTATGGWPTQRTLTLTLSPNGGDVRVEEVELWGGGLPPAPRDVQVLAERTRDPGNLPFSNVHAFSAQPTEATLTPRGLGQDDHCATFYLGTPLPVRTVRRAHLVYEATGVQRPVVLRRSFNAQPTQGGFWLGAGTRERTLADELNPELLTGNDRVTLCLPEEATQVVTLRGVRLLLELDDGSQPFDQEAALRLRAALDGDSRTSATFPGGSVELPFSRPLSVDSALLELDVPASEVTPAVLETEGWKELAPMALPRGRTPLAVDGQVARGVRLSFSKSRRPDVPSVSVSEVVVTGSGVGPRIAAPRLVITSPALELTSEGFSGEHFGDRAYVAGWAESPAGRGVVEVDGIPADSGDGHFGMILSRPTNRPVWTVTVRARFPDGSEALRVLTFDRDRAAEIDADLTQNSGGLGNETALFGEEEQTSWGRVDRDKGGRVELGSRVAFEAPPGAVDGPVSVGITRKMPESLPRLDPGMVNVTAPVNAGYRFSPPGQRFLKPVAVTLPYEPTLLPEGIPAEQIQTYYFDRGADQWKPLQRKQVLRATQQVVSETTHFTFMINAVLVLPDHPGPVSFDPNSLKDLKAAEPAAGMALIEPPEGNNQGSARLGLELQLPGARGGYTPSLQLMYDSNGGNSWLGVGWELPISSVQVDTRFGAPFHDGSERFVLDGDQLVPTGDGPCVDGSTGKQYASRVENAFRRVVHCGQGSSTDRFEVAQQNGVLLLYGVTPGARVADAARIGQWMLERVVDPHGNLTLYRYTPDFRRATGTRFDQDNLEPFHQLYPRELLYTGKVARADAVKEEQSFLQAAELGPYLVVFKLEEDGAGGLLERPDILINGRMGFKTVTRYRLGRVQVRMNTLGDTSIIREYRFTYQRGDFGKSRLRKVEQFGEGGVQANTFFHAHEFGYRSVDTHGATAFSEAVAWPFAQPDADAMTASEEWSLGAHAYAGIGFTFDKQQGSVGARVGFNHRQSDTRATLMDFNGDGLPDRVSQDGSQLYLQLNHGDTPLMSRVAPAGDPYAGRELRAISATGPSLGSESGDSVDIGLQGTFSSFSFNVSHTTAWTTSSRFIADADGDGLVDFFTPAGVLFNQPRGTGVCAPSTFCFAARKPGTSVLDFGNYTGALGTFDGDPAVTEARQQVEKGFHPTDAMLEWTAPFTGNVNVSGTLAWPEGATTGAQRDGVRLRIYRGSELLAEYAKSPGDAVPTAVSKAGVQVKHLDRLYFVLSTLRNFPVDTGVSPPRPLEEIRFAPVVRYTACTNGCGGLGSGDAELLEPTGASVFTFDAQKDFKLAGAPLTAIQAPQTGDLRLTGRYDSQGAADDVRLCIQRSPPGQVQQRPCQPTDILPRTYPGGVGHEAFTQLVRVQAGDSLVFRMETDLSIDPDSVKWELTGEMVSVCGEDGHCETPTPEERERLRFEAAPYLALHGRFDDIPLRPLVIPRGGTLHIQSSANGGVGQFFTARKHNALLLKHPAGGNATVSLPVNQGEQILFEAHSELRSEGETLWDLSVALEVPGSDGGSEYIPLDAPIHITYEQDPLAPRKQSPFGGGFHGWRYGLWGGRPAIGSTPEEPFDAEIFYSDAELELGDGNERDQFREGKGQLRNEESETSRRSRLFAPLVPRSHGTQAHPKAPGLKPTTAFVSQDGTAFITANAMHGGHKGAVASGEESSYTVASSLRIGDTARSSVSENITAGLGASLGGAASLSFNVSTSTSEQRQDVRDMNGDGIVDMVVNGQSGADGVLLTHLRARNQRTRVTGSDRYLSKSSDLTATLGMGLSAPVPQLSAGGRLRAMTAMFPKSLGVGAGVAATFSATDMDLVDINGDGLPDQVRRERGKNVLKVRLNLGSRFAAQEDQFPVTPWDLDDQPYDPFVDGLDVEQPENADTDEQEGRTSALGALEGLASPDVVRRATALTLQGNLGFTFKEDYGVTANWSSSLNGTQVVLTDVTGDGLPDYVRKSSSDGSFRVKVNQGYGFSREEEWPVHAWPAGVTRPRFKLNPALDSTVVPLLGLENGIDTVEASGSHSRVPSVGFVITVPIPLGLGTPWLHLSGGADFTPERVSGFELGLQDINGDGLVDHVLKTEERVARRGETSPGERPNRNALYARLNGYAGSNLLETIKRPLGGSITLGYQRQGNTVDMPQSRWVLSSVQVDDGTGNPAPGHTLVTRYDYVGGYYDRHEREFFGFSSVTRIQPNDSRVVRTYRNDRFTHKGLLVRDETRDAQGRLFLARLNTYDEPVVRRLPRPECMAFTPFFLSPADYCASIFVPLRRTESRVYEGRTQDVNAPEMASAQVMQYDPETGNVTKFDDLGDVADPSDDLHANVSYETNPALLALHHRSLVQRLDVWAGPRSSPGSVLRRREGFHDARGDLVRHLAHISEGRAAETLLSWNTDGLLASVTAPPNAHGQRYQVHYTYDPVIRSQVSGTRDSFGYTSSAEYDPHFNAVIRTVDVAGHTTVRDYDVFGRLSKLWGPYDSSTGAATIEVHYGHDARPAWALTRNRLPVEGNDDQLDTVFFVDGLGRLVQSKKDVEVSGSTVGHSVSGHQTYDIMGQVAKQGQSIFHHGSATTYVPGTPVRPTFTEYDVLGRVVRTVDPDGSVSQTVYDFGTPAGTSVKQMRASVTDALLNVRVIYRDVSEDVSAVEERIGGRALTTHYETDPLGQIHRIVDAANNATLNHYDWLGRRTAMSTPDTGLVELRHDDANNLIEKIDANLRAARQSIKYEYEYSRLKRIDRPYSEDIVYQYGGPGPSEDNGAGRIVRVDDEAGYETRAYGRLGEVVRSTRAVRALRPSDRERTFETRFEHDSFGRMLRIVYPDAEELRYTYDAGGLLKSATGYRPGSRHAPPEVQVYLRRLEYDHFGQRTFMRLGNGAETTYTYEPDTRRLSSLKTRTPRGRTLQALSYQYDRMGNLLGMTNALGQPVGRRSGSVSYTFNYDALYRLTSARGVALARPGLIDRFESTFAYSDIHNLERKVQVHELLTSRSPQGGPARPDHSNHDDAYVYGGAGPHQATRIGDMLLTYDLNGNTLIECRTVNGSGCADTGDATPPPQTHNHYRRYVWTEDNTLRTVVDGGGRNTTRFFYDADGERVVKLGRGGTSLSIGQFFSVKGKRHGTKHIFAGPTRLASKLLPVPDGDIGFPERPAGGDGTSGTVLTSGTPDPGNENGCEPGSYQPQKCPVIVEPPPGGTGGEPLVRPATYYYHPDHLGSTSWVTDQQGRVHEHVEYFPYGEVWRDQRYDDDGAPVRAPNYLFSGKELDEETGLGYFGARYYDPRKARWVSADPFREQWGKEPIPPLLSVYGYSYHSPLVMKDPDGRLPNVVVGAAAGAVIGGAVYSVTKAFTGGFTWRGFGAAVAGGTVSGAVAGATFGTSLVAQAAGSAAVGSAAGVAGGVTSRAIETGSAQEAFSPGAMIKDGVLGGAFGAAGGAIRNAVATRTVASTTLANTATKTTVRAGSEVTDDAIRSVMVDAPLKTHQPSVSVPAIRRYVDRLAAGETPPAIKVDNGIIVDGNHRYIAGRLFGVEPPQTPGVLSNFKTSQPTLNWRDVFLDAADWGNK
jgi:RHS repeat-associated protein